MDFNYSKTIKSYSVTKRPIVIDLTAPDDVVAGRTREAVRKGRVRGPLFVTQNEEQTGGRRAKDSERSHRERHKKSNKIKPKCEELLIDVKDRSPKKLFQSLKTDSNKDMFADVDADEIAEYKKLFPNLEDIVERRVHCTSCNWHIGTAPNNATVIKMHPLLRVIQCKKCYTFYSRGEFECDDDGREYYCRWCGQGDEVYCCAKCPKVYCRRCLEQNLSRKTVLDIENNEDWICFACEPACTVQLRADYWALLNFIAKQKKEISNKALTEDEFYEAMSKDRSICCPNITHSVNLKRKLSSSIDSTKPAKRTYTGIARREPPLIINDALAKLKEVKNPIISKPPSNDTIIENISPHIEPLKLISAEDSSQTLQPMSETVQQSFSLDTHTKNTKDKSFFFKISGFSIDLQEASQQGYYRLPNGNVIQVKKLPTSGKTPTKSKDFKVQTMEDPMTSTTTLLPPTMGSSKIIPSTIDPLIVNSSSQISPTMIYPTPLNPMSSTTISPLLNKTRPALVSPNPIRSVSPNVLLKSLLAEGCSPKLTQIRPSLSLQPRQMNQIQRNFKAPEQSTVPVLVQLNRNPDVPEPNQSQPPQNQIRITSAYTVPTMTQIKGKPNIQEPSQSQSLKSDNSIISVSTAPIISINRNAILPEPNQSSHPPENQIRITSVSTVLAESIHSKSPESDIRITSDSTVPVIRQIHRNLKITEPNKTSQPPESKICITSMSTGQTNLLFDEAKAQFEIRVDDSIEVCEHIIGKMKFLTNSTAFKSAKSIADVRDLIMQLSYLLTFGGSRFKSLQEYCDEDMKVIGFDSDNNDEIEILEPNITLIDLDSDENDINDSESDIMKAANNFDFIDIIELHDSQLMTNYVSQIEIDTNPTLISEYTNKNVTHSTEITAESGESSIDEVVNIFENGAKPKNNNDGRVKNIDITKESQTSKDVACDKSSLVDEATIDQDTEIIQAEIAKVSSEINADITNNKLNVKGTTIVNCEKIEDDVLAKCNEYMIKNLLRNASCPLEMPEEKFKSIFRLSRESFKFLLDKMPIKLNMNKTKTYVPPILMLAATLSYLADGNLQQSNDEDFSLNLCRRTIYCIIADVLNTLDSMSDIFLQLNQSTEDRRKCSQYYYLKMGFPGVVGCVDGTHVNIIRPNSDDFFFRNKKGNYSLNVMVSCDFKLLITSVVTNRGGHSDDSSVWSLSRARKCFVQEYKAGHKDSLLIADSGYPLEPWLMTPYKSAPPGSKEAKFNEIHSKCRASIKRCFGVLKGRFRCLSSERPLFDKPKKIAQLVNVACKLHNFCIKRNVEFEESLFVTDEEDFDYNVRTTVSDNRFFEAEAIRDGIKNLL